MKKRELTREELREIRSLITTMCANYDKHYGCCMLLDDYGCYMLTKRFTGSLCKYFEKAVLPLNPKLGSSLLQKDVSIKPCSICGRDFAPTGRQKYCSPRCTAEGNRIKGREWTRKSREKRG